MKRRSDPKVDMLRRVPRLSGLRERELAELAPLLEVVDLPAGAVIAQEGRPGYETLIIVDGRVEVRVGGKVVNEVGPGEFVGEMAQLDRGRRCATATALTPVRGLLVGPQTFAPLAANSSVALAMLDGMVDRMRRTQASAATGAPAPLDASAKRAAAAFGSMAR